MLERQGSSLKLGMRDGLTEEQRLEERRDL